MATPDANNEMPLLVVDDNGAVTTALIDNATGYLLIDITNGGSPSTQSSSVDVNNVPSGLVVDTGDEPAPILTNTDNKIFINFTAL